MRPTYAEEEAALMPNDPNDRTRQILWAGVVVVFVSAVAAGLIIFQGGPDASTAPLPHLRTAAGANSLVLGLPKAPTHVVVYEDFLSPESRDFEMGTRDFLHADAADGKAYVEYRPLALLNDDSGRVLNAFASVLSEAGPVVGLKYYDLLFDNQPAMTATPPDDDYLIGLAGQVGVSKAKVTDPIENLMFKSWITGSPAAHVTTTPVVLVNGTKVTGTSIDDLASTLETTIASG